MSGEQCVMINGNSMREMWSAGSWDMEVSYIITVNRMDYYRGSPNIFVTGAIQASGGASFGQGTGEIVLDDLQCTGSESSLFECPQDVNGRPDCSHREDAGVICAAGMCGCIACFKLFTCTVFTCGCRIYIEGNFFCIYRM